MKILQIVLLLVWSTAIAGGQEPKPFVFPKPLPSPPPFVAAPIPAPTGGTITTLSGEKYTQAVVTSMTPAALTISHSTGVASVPFIDLPREIQEKYQYDPAKDKAWRLSEAARITEANRKAKMESARIASDNEKRANAETAQEQARIRGLYNMLDYVHDGGTIGYDRASQTFYPSDLAEARRAAAIEFFRRNGYWPGGGQ